jgi:HPt (histidine-containing phosphotransfer) domain-containing protein
MTRDDATAAAEVLALDRALENLAGDLELLQEITETFVEFVPNELDTLAQLIAADDAAAVATRAHGLKGAALNLGAAPFVAAALALEKEAREGRLDDASDLLAGMRREFERIRDSVASLDWNRIAT